MNDKINILAVDDEELNLDIIEEYLEGTNCNYITANDGVEALKVLETGIKVDVIVLDRMMPNMNGMEFLNRIKNSDKYKSIPVIMQTAATSSHQVAEGIVSGVFYYLGKPYSKEVLLSLIKTANNDRKERMDIIHHLRRYGEAMKMVQQADFKFKTIKDARALALLVSSCLEDAESKLIGLTELMINSVEHGNLGITYEEKTELKNTNKWDEEIASRMSLLKNKNKYCDLHINFNEATNEFTIKVKDKGDGFDWLKFTQLDPKRLTDPNGRGILISQNSGFSQVRYLNNGSEFECISVAKASVDN